MDKIRLGQVGCGGMGTRRIYGLQELSRTPFCNVELAALCDIRLENAELAATEAEQLLGTRPQVFTDLEEMVRQVLDLVAADVVTDPATHHDVVCQALDLGLHVMVEKPLAITVKACHRMIEAARRNDRKLLVAENFRRDPSARLVRHLLDQGAIGTPYMATHHTLGGYRNIFITPWRHLKEKGGFILDEGVHYADLMRYHLGDVAQVYEYQAEIDEALGIGQRSFRHGNYGSQAHTGRGSSRPRHRRLQRGRARRGSGQRRGPETRPGRVLHRGTCQRHRPGQRIEPAESPPNLHPRATRRCAAASVPHPLRTPRSAGSGR